MIAAKPTRRRAPSQGYHADVVNLCVVRRVRDVEPLFYAMVPVLTALGMNVKERRTMLGALEQAWFSVRSATSREALARRRPGQRRRRSNVIDLAARRAQDRRREP